MADPMRFEERLLRGGSWLSDPENCRSACRFHFHPDDANYNVGFRVVCLSQSAPNFMAKIMAQIIHPRLLRGGSWFDNSEFCRSAYRFRKPPAVSLDNVGFRLASRNPSATTINMVEIPAGRFLMGSPTSEKGRFSSESPQHKVKLNAFWMSQFPITQSQWVNVMGTNPSRFKGDQRPVENVSWHNAMEFCRQLSQRTGRTYTLPSEAQWEYACRAGTTTPFSFGETITTDQANHDGNYTYGNGHAGESHEQTTDVGTFPANPWGLHDMHGNVWEWCLDEWHRSYQGAPTDGSAWEGSDNG